MGIWMLALAQCEIHAAAPTPVGRTATLSVKSAAGAPPIRFSWDFGDGAPPGPYSTATSASHVYSKPGHYAVVLRALDANGASSAATTTQTIHEPLAAVPPASSSTIIVDDLRVWAVNPDAGTVARIEGLAKTRETPVGAHPRTLARAPDGTIWVVSQDSASISVLSAAGDVLSTLPLPRASRPFGIVFIGSTAYVTLQGAGRLLKIDATSRAIAGTLDVGAQPRHLATDGARILVARFLSPELVEVAASSFSVTRVFALATDPGPDTERGARGVPNYLGALAITPDGRRAWIPSKKDNMLRGLTRDGLPLTFESSVRTIVSQIDLAANVEGPRVDFNDHDLACAVAFSRHGDLAFVLTQGTNTVQILDAYAEERTLASIRDVGQAPQGLAFDAARARLYTQNFMSRTVDVYDVAGVVEFTTNSVVKLATIPTVAVETLSAAELLGKRVFYNAADRRMNRDGYVSCASCHLDGGGDGRVWDFSDRGEGLRNTTDLRGRRGTGHGRVHWTANFDEIQDFEHDIRGPFAGSGFLPDAAFQGNTPLGSPKAGLSAELDALAAYAASLREVPPSPHRRPDGLLSPDGFTGRAIFDRLRCAACHAGADFTDSVLGALHDVGTIRPASGRRLGGTLTGLDTPTLKGIWDTAPYLHDGSAATIEDVLRSERHGGTAALSADERRALAAYLLQLDESDARVLRQDAGGLVSLRRPSARHATSHAWVDAGGSWVATPNTGAQLDPGLGPRLDYHVRFQKSGTHYVHARGRGATASDNSVHLGLNGRTSSSTERVGSFPAEWRWMSTTMDGARVAIDIPAPGVHTLHVWMREDGFELDRLLVTTDPGYSPAGEGPPESALEEVEGPSTSGAGGSGGGSCGVLGLEALVLAWLMRRRG